MTIMSSSSNHQHHGDMTTTTTSNIIHRHHHQQQQQQQQRHTSTPFIQVPSSYHSSIRNRNNSHDNTLSSAFQIPWSPTMINSNESLSSTTNPNITTTLSSDLKTTNDQALPQKVVAPAECSSTNSSILQQEFSRQPHALLSQRETVQQLHNSSSSQQQQQSNILNMIPEISSHGSDPLSNNTTPNLDNTAGRGQQQQQRQEYNNIDIINNNNYPDSSSCSSWEQQQHHQQQNIATTTTATTNTRNSQPNDNITATTNHYSYEQNSKALQSSQHNNNESSNHITPNSSMFTSFGNSEQPYNSSHMENSATAAATASWATGTSLWSGNGTTDTPYSASSSSTSNNSTTQHQHPTLTAPAPNTTNTSQQQQQQQQQQQRYLSSTSTSTDSRHSQQTNNNNTMNPITEEHFSLDFLAPPPASSLHDDSSQARKHSHSILSNSYNNTHDHTSTMSSTSTIETVTNICTLDQQYHPRSISPLPLPPVSTVSSMSHHNNSNISSSTFEIFDPSFLNSNNTNNSDNGSGEHNNSSNNNSNKNDYHQQVSTSGPASTSSFNDSLLPVRSIPMSNVKAGVRTARMMVDAAMATKLRPQIQSYLLAADPVAMGERTVVILTGKVAQKSYGTEKRFLCPPPTVILDGASWWTNKKQEQSDSVTSITTNNNNNNINNAPPQLMVSMSGETSETQEGQVDWFSMSGTTVGQTGFGGNTNGNNSGRNNNSLRNSFDKSSSSDRDWYRIQPRDPLAGGKCVLRQLYINDADDKRKRVECLARLQLADGTPVGTLASKPVKVISKPSKKRLSVKNMDSCIHHGTTVSLFNRIRSQTVSTKYLGVSASAGATSSTQPFMYPGQSKANHNLDGPASTSSPDGTCFIARTGSWDPFIIWLVDTTWVPHHHHERESNSPDEYIGSGASTLRNDIPYPPPPAIAAKNKTGQPLAVHYNQHIVLQCLTTGLVSPVMIIRKIDRASTVVGGANSKYYSHYNNNRSTAELSTPSGTNGGEYGDEILGDPVSQLHKVALQIVQDPSSTAQTQQQHNNDLSTNMFSSNTNNSTSSLPRVNRPVTYLACLNDMVGMHRSAHDRKPIRAEPPPTPSSNMSTPTSATATTNIFEPASNRAAVRRRIASTGNAEDYYYGYNQQQHQQSMYSTINFQGAVEEYHHQQHPSQPHNNYHQITGKRSRSVSAIDQANDDIQHTTTTSWSELGAFWSEDVSDSAVWTIVGTDCAKYTFWELPSIPNEDEYMDNRFLDMSLKVNQPRQVTIAPVPTLLRYSRSKGDNDGLFLSMHGESFTRDLEVWFGDVRSPRSEYRGREHLVCEVPMASELAHSVGAEWKNGGSCSVPLLLVRRNGGALYKTNKYYTFC